MSSILFVSPKNALYSKKKEVIRLKIRVAAETEKSVSSFMHHGSSVAQ